MPSDDDPVVVIEHKALYTTESEFDPNLPRLALGSARIARAGNDVTVVASLAMVARAIDAADELAKEGISVEVIDACSILPLDIGMISESVRRTGRLVTVEEQPVDAGWGSHLIASVLDSSFDRLTAPPLRLGTPYAPIAFSPLLEDAALPSAQRIADGLRATARWA
jgi:pyruvate dehydrogenase E1 component beta subunit